MFQDMKQAKDALDPDNDDNNRKMWALCDLGMTLVSYRTHNFTLREHPAKTVLSRRFFTNLIRHENNTELYLPKEIIDEEKTKQSRAKKGKGNAAEPVDVSEVVNHEVEKQQKHAKSDQKPIVSGKRRKSSIKTPLQKKPVAKVLPRSSEVKIPKKSTRQSTKTKSGRILRGKKNMSEAEESASGSEDEVAESERDESDDDKPIASISPKKSGGPSPKKPLKRLALTSSSSSSEMKSIGSGVAKRSSDPSGISTSYTSKLRYKFLSQLLVK